MKYRIGLVDNLITLPPFMDIEFTSLEDAYNVISSFVHTFDGKPFIVDGRVMDEDGNDVEYCSSIQTPKKGYKVYARISGWASQYVKARSKEEAIEIAKSRPERWGDDYEWGLDKTWASNYPEAFPDETTILGALCEDECDGCFPTN